MEGMFFDSYDTPVFRPPSEARSFILRVTRGCAHNRCTYCNMYRGVRFERLDDEAILRQIALAEHYGKRSVRRVFLADGDAFVLDTDRLLAILAELHRAFPLLERVSSYAAPRDILRKSPEEMEKLREAGLGLLYTVWRAATRRLSVRCGRASPARNPSPPGSGSLRRGCSSPS